MIWINNKEYTKTYKPLVAWFIAYLIIPVVIIMNINLSEKMETLIYLFLTVLGIDILLFIIYKGEYVYWFTGGPNFKEAKALGSKSRKQYAKEILDLFIKMTIICLIYAIISIVFKFTTGIDIIIISLAIVVAAFLSMPIKFKK